MAYFSVVSSAPLVAVVIPTRDMSHLLPHQLRALEKQVVLHPWEVLVVDNGSTDDLDRVISEFQDRLPLRLIREDRLGVGFAMAAGVRASQSPYILFLDADDEVDEAYVPVMIEALQHYEMAGGRLDTESLNPPWIVKARGRPQGSALPNPLDFLPFSFGAALGIRRSTLDKIGGLPLRSSSGIDVELCWRGQLAGVPLTFVPEAILRYRYRTEVRAMFGQAVRFGRTHTRMYALFGGRRIRRQSLRTLLGTYALILVGFLRSHNRVDLVRSVFRLGVRWGRLRGSIEHRVFFP